MLLVIPRDCRLDRSAAQRFRAKLLAHADSDRFPDTRLRADAKPHSYRDSKGADAHQPQSYSEFNSNSDSNSDTNAAIPRSQCHANSYTYASACISLAAFG